MKRLHRSRHGQAAIGALLLLMLSLPPLRPLLEESMRLHMLVQYPLVVLAGLLLGRAVSPALARRLSTWNALGLTGLAAAMLVTSVLMIPRVLDLALIDARVEVAKFAALLFVGAVLRSSWREAGNVVQAFFLGGFLPMTIAVGTLYQEMPLRLCNAYRLDDQQDLGQSLVYLAVAMTAVWLVRTARSVIAAEAEEAPVR
ncbi:MAG: hypothetical protein K8R60_02375 [Burkholderiales bacterium]|nr:hypothetical protein [Burkholderiales bacterium]